MEDKMEKRGYWEEPGHNPLIGAFVILSIVGISYFFSQVVLVNGLIMADMLIRRPDIGGDGSWFSNMVATYRYYKPLILIILTLCQWGGLLGLTALLYKKWHGGSIRRYFRLDRLDLGGLLLAIPAALLIIPGVDYIARLSYNLFPIFEKFSEASLPLFQADSPLELIFTILVIGVTPAVCEEFLFRGYFQRTLGRKLGAPWSFILAGSLFALFHQQVLSLPALIPAGIFLSYLYHRYDSLYISMAAHFVYNSALVLFTNFPDSTKLFVGSDGGFSLPVILVSSLLFLALLAGMALSRKKQLE